MEKILPIIKKIVLICVITFAIWFVHGHFVAPIFVKTNNETFVKLFFNFYLPITAAIIIFSPKHLLLKVTLSLVFAAAILFGIIPLLLWIGVTL